MIHHQIKLTKIMQTDSYYSNDSNPKIAVIIPTHNRWNLASRAIKSLEADSYSNKEILLVEDGCTDETRQQVAIHHPNVKVCHGDGNLWWSGAINLGLINALNSTYDLVLWLNDDNYVEKNTIECMVNAHKLFGINSVIAARTRSVHLEEDEWNGHPPRWHPDYNTWEMTSVERDYVPLVHPPGGRGVLFSIKCFQELGLIDQNCFPHYWADHDFHYRAMNAGYKYYLAADAVVWNTPNSPGVFEHDKYSMLWIIRFIFSRRSAMNLFTLRRLLIRHLPPKQYNSIWPQLWRNTILWLFMEWLNRYPFLFNAVKLISRINSTKS